MVLAFLPQDRPQKREKFDYAGAIILAVALSSLVLVLDKGQEWGWASLKSFLAYLATVVSGISFIFLKREQRIRSLISIFSKIRFLFRRFRSLSFLLAGLWERCFSFRFSPRLFSVMARRKPDIFFCRLALTMMVVSPLGRGISDHIAPRWSVSVGMLISTIGFFILSQRLDPLTTGERFGFPVVFFAFGLGLGMAPLTNAVASSVPPREVGIASGILNLTRNIAGAIGIAFFGTLLTNQINSKVQEISANTAINSSSRITSENSSRPCYSQSPSGFLWFCFSWWLLSSCLPAL